MEFHKGSEREGDLEIRGDDPAKQKGRRRAFHGDRYKYCLLADRDGGILLTAYAPAGVTEFNPLWTDSSQVTQLCSLCRPEEISSRPSLP